MKNALLILCATILFSTNSFGRTIKTAIKDAIAEKKIDLIIEGHYGYDNSKYSPVDGTGVFNGKCIAFSVKSNYDSIVHLSIPVGAKLGCKDSTVQDMIITKSFELVLYPRRWKYVRIYAMCGEVDDRAPRKGIFYEYIGITDSSVVSIARAIEEKNLQNFIGQYCMWSVTDNANEAVLKYYGADSLATERVISTLNEVGLQVQLNTQDNTIEEMESIPDDDSLIGEIWIGEGNGPILLIVILSVTSILLLGSSIYYRAKSKRNSS